MKHKHFRLSGASKIALLLAALSAVPGAALAEKINLNTADAEAMAYIPGIGQSRAEQIIQARRPGKRQRPGCGKLADDDPAT